MTLIDLQKSKMTLSVKITWIIIIIVALIINSIFPFSAWLIILNFVPVILTSYLIITYSKEFKFNTPWGIPYLIIVFINISILENIFSKAATYYNLTYLTAITIKLSFAILLFVVVTLLVKKSQQVVKEI